MVASVTAVRKRLKTEWATQSQPEAIIAACEEAGYTSWRDRVLTRPHYPALPMTDVARQHRVQPCAPSVGPTIQRVGRRSSPYGTPPRPLSVWPHDRVADGGALQTGAPSRTAQTPTKSR